MLLSLFDKGRGILSRAAASRVVSPLIKSSTLLGAAHLIASVCNYLFLVVAGRNLDKQEFGSLSAILSIVSLSLVLFNPYQLLMAAAAQQGRLSIRWQLLKLLLLCVVLVSGVSLFRENLSALIAASTQGFIGAAIGISLVGCNALMNGALSGIKYFGGVAANGVSSSLGRLLILAVLLPFGISIESGLAAYNGGLLIGAMCGLMWWSRRPAVAEVNRNIAPTVGGSVAFTAVFLVLVAPFFLDQLLVESLHRPYSGDYSAITNLSKILLFATAPIITATYPYLLEARHSPSVLLRIFLVSSLLCSLIVGGVALPLYFLPDQIMIFSFGTQYEARGALVPVAALGMMFHVGANLIAQLVLVTGPLRGFIPLLGTLIIQLILFAREFQTVEDLIWCQVIVFVCQFCLLALSSMLIFRTRSPS